MQFVVTNPRFEAGLPIRTSGQSAIFGELINISRTGAKIKLDTNLPRNVNSYLSFYVYLDGKKPEEKPRTPTFHRRSSKENPENRLKLVSKIIRYADENGDECLGIQIVEPEGEEKLKLQRFLQELEHKNRPTSFEDHGQDQIKPLANLGFTLRFTTIRDVIDFLPQDPKQAFFIPTSTPRSSGSEVIIVMIHPKKNKQFQFHAIVESFDQSNPKGAWCKYKNLDFQLLEKIKKFIEL